LRVSIRERFAEKLEMYAEEPEEGAAIQGPRKQRPHPAVSLGEIRVK
jgi:hypothetical protein